MDISQLLRGGDTRAYIPSLPYNVVYCLPTAILGLLVSSTKLSTPVKQVLAFPIILAAFLIPINFTCHQRIIDVSAAAVCYNTVLRFLEFFYIGPLLQGRPAYADMNYLHDQLWHCLREIPRKNGKSKKGDDKNSKDTDAQKPETKESKEDAKENSKDKKFYHILFYFCGHALVCDVVGSLFYTYTATDVTKLEHEQPFLFAIFFALAIVLMTAAFNVVGYGLQLFYCLYYQKGSYSSKEYRSLMRYPIMSSSLDELWSVRWHQLFHTSWVAFGFRPTWIVSQRILSRRFKNPKQISFFLSVFSVFIASAFMHEYMIYCNVGWTVYRQFFFGQQLYFFCVHGVGTAFERFVSDLGKRYIPAKYRTPLMTGIVGRLWVLVFSWFTFPYFLHGFAYWGVWHSNPFVFTRPFVQEFLRTTPGLRQLCGSLLV